MMTYDRVTYAGEFQAVLSRLLMASDVNDEPVGGMSTKSRRFMATAFSCTKSATWSKCRRKRRKIPASIERDMWLKIKTVSSQHNEFMHLYTRCLQKKQQQILFSLSSSNSKETLRFFGKYSTNNRNSGCDCVFQVPPHLQCYARYLKEVPDKLYFDIKLNKLIFSYDIQSSKHKTAKYRMMQKCTVN